MTQRVDKDSLPLNQPRRTPSHPTKSHIVKTKVDGKEKILRFGEQGASTAGKPKEGESERMKAKRASFKARHGKNIAKGQSSPAYWANKVKWADGGAVSLDALAAKYDNGGEVSVEDLLARLEAATPLERQTYETLGMEPGLDRATFLPIAGSRSGGDLQMAVPQFVYDIGKAFVTPGAAVQGVPLSYEDVVNMAGNTMGGGLAISSPVEGAVAGMAIKQKGGNWLDKSVAKEIKEIEPQQAPSVRLAAVRRLRELEEAYAQNVEAGVFEAVDEAFMQHVREQTKPDIAINNWLETKLNKYIRNEMGTPEDPVRALAERGTLHYSGQRRGPQVTEDLRQAREMEGFPGAGLGQSELARRWETATDTAITPGQAKNYLNTINREGELTTERYPWLLKVPPETPVYDLAASNNMGALGFNHLVDELRNATRLGTDLPERLRIDYNKLDRMTVPQIVEKVANINAWRTAQRVEANQMLANNAATTVFKEYPEQGLKWVELREPEVLPDIGDMLVQNQGKYSIVEPGSKLSWKDPSSGRVLFDTPEAAAAAYGKSKNYKFLEEALKYEGDTMGHCVGGYCPAVSSGKTKIFSLRDEKGSPHVTIEVSQNRSYGTSHLNAKRPEAEALALKEGLDPESSAFVSFVNAKMTELANADLPVSIKQIKGKGNAKPADKYLPAVQDFVRSGTWDNVGDLQNTGLVKGNRGSSVIHDGPNRYDVTMPEASYYTRRDLADHFESQGVPTLAAKQHAGDVEGLTELLARPPVEGFAQGGTVRAYDQLQVESIMNSINAPRNYATGGSVLAYDPSRVDAILNQFRGAE